MAVQRRLEFALETIKGSDWAVFEQLSSSFLAAEFSGLRTTASPAGDEGRDAELFRIGENASVVFQFSVAGDWRSKIRRTIKRLRDVGNTPSVLIYMSNQEIGASGDLIKKEAIASGLTLDIRDRNWFRERACADGARRDASDEFARAIVDPILDDKALLSKAAGLGGQEARTALLYLEMQSRDENISKGLTKSCYEALVKCSLRGTTSENRKTVDDIRTHIQGLLPQHSHSALDPFIVSALERLSNTALKRWDRDGIRTYHISHEESLETKDRIAGLLLLNQAFFDDVREILDREPAINTSRHAEVFGIVRSIVETYFYRLGEEFAQTVVSESLTEKEVG